MNKRFSLFAAACVIVIASFGSCSFTELGGGKNSESCGTVSIGLGSSSSSRAATAPASSLVSTYTVVLTDSRGTIMTVSNRAAGSTANFVDVFPGTFSASATTCDADGNVNGAGSATGTVSAGESVSISIPVSVRQTGEGSGSMALRISFPTGHGITDVRAAFVSGDAAEDVPVTRTYDSSLSDGAAILSASDVPSGARLLSVSFYEGAFLLGSIVEAVNVWNGVETSRWLSADETLVETRVYTAAEITDSSAALCSLTVAGKQVDLAAARFSSGADITGSSTASYIGSGGFVFVPVGMTAGQTITYAWNGAAGPAAVSSGEASPVLSGGTPASGIDTLVVTVASPGGQRTQTYTVVFRRAFTVAFVSARVTLPAPQKVLYGETAANPGALSSSGAVFGGWYADEDFSAVYDFSSPVAGDTLIYAKWISSGSVSIVLSSPAYQAVRFEQFGSAVKTITMDKNAKLTFSLPQGGADYEWRVDNGSSEGSSSSFTFNPTVRSINAGKFTLTAVFTYGGVRYSGDLSILVTNDYMVEILPYGRTAVYLQDGWYYTDASQTLYPSFSHTLTRPYSLGKYEVSYGLWKPVRDWALENGYIIGNTGAEGSSGSAGVDHPVTCVSYFDALVWCNAYSEMSGLAPCYYTSTADRTDASVLRSTAFLTSLASSKQLYTPKYADLDADGYRLPSEGEWQFAASCGGYYSYNQVSGSTAVFNSGNPLTYSAWANSHSGSTTPCGSTTPNIWGLYDMSGNMWEACFDVCTYPPDYPVVDYVSDEYSGVNNGGYLIIVKGGSFSSTHPIGKSTIGHRDNSWSTMAASDSGFRIARTLKK